MGVINLTPDSFSDGGEVSSDNLLKKIQLYNQFDYIDIGAESTAPMNEAISFQEEWRRLSPFIELLPYLQTTISLDTYHPETIFKFAEVYKGPLLWNDVSGKFDRWVNDFLNLRLNCTYIFSHNLAPEREKTTLHMNYLSVQEGEDFLKELKDYFLPYKRERVIFDPCLGFSKNFHQNWMILDHLSTFIESLDWKHWLIGFSRKSFLRQKYQCDLKDKIKLDELHLTELKRILPRGECEIIIRTHRPELLAKSLVSSL